MTEAYSEIGRVGRDANSTVYLPPAHLDGLRLLRPTRMCALLEDHLHETI